MTVVQAIQAEQLEKESVLEKLAQKEYFILNFNCMCCIFVLAVCRCPKLT